MGESITSRLFRKILMENMRENAFDSEGLARAAGVSRVDYSEIAKFIVRELSLLGWSLEQIEEANLYDISSILGVPEGGSDSEEGEQQTAVAKEVTQTLETTYEWTPAALAVELDVSTECVSNHAKAIGVQTPGRGKNNHSYSWSDAMRIAKRMQEKGVATTRSAASDFLQRHSANPIANPNT